MIDSVGSPGDEVWTQLSASYEAVAHKYEAQFADEMADKPRDRELLSSFAEAVTDPVLEVGCGPGQVGAFVRGCGRAVYGFDFSSQMTKLASVRLDGAVVALYSFIHVRRQGLPDVLREVHRVLRPEGRVLFSVHEGEGVLGRDRFLDEPVPFIATLYMLDELVAVCRDTGLTVSRAERRLPYSSESTVRLR